VRTMEVTAKVKAAGVADGLAEGQFIALVSAFNNEDSTGDVVRPGAFTQTLQDWAAKGDDIPVIWAHQWSDPFAHIGRVIKAVETLQGLEVTGQIDDLGMNSTADQVYRLLKGRRVTQFSFAYDIGEGGWITDDQHPWGGYYELRRLDLHEVGPCLIGVNRETELLAAKAATLAAGAKAGRVLSQKNYDVLTAAYESIGEVLAAATPEPDKARGLAGPKKNGTPEETGQPGSAAASGDTPPAQPSEPAPAQDAPEEAQKETSSSTEEETTPGPREASDDAAKAGAASARLRTDLELLELEASLTE
jgi:HK97 family phage prohead protease